MARDGEGWTVNPAHLARLRQIEAAIATKRPARDRDPARPAAERLIAAVDAADGQPEVLRAAAQAIQERRAAARGRAGAAGRTRAVRGAGVG